MPTNLAIDDRLIDQAKRLDRHRTKKDTVNAALDEYIRRRKQAALVPLFSRFGSFTGARRVHPLHGRCFIPLRDPSALDSYFRIR